MGVGGWGGAPAALCAAVFKTGAAQWAVPEPALPHTQPGGFAGPAQSALGGCAVAFVV